MARHNKDRMDERGSGVAEAAHDTASEASEAAQGLASTVMKKAEDAASFIGKKADDATSAMGSGIKSLGGTIREHTPDKGVLGGASSAVAGTLESGGRYLEKHGLSGMGEDLTNLIRRHPIPSVLIGIGLGFMVARMTTSRG